MLDFLDCFKYELKCAIKPDDDTLQINKEAVRRLNELEEGNHVYLLLQWQDKYEHVKFTKTTDLKSDIITVERDVENKGRKNFPRGACVSMTWTKFTLDEYISQGGKQ